MLTSCCIRTPLCLQTAAVALQAVSVAGVCFGVADTCATWAPFTHTESRAMFAATAARLDELTMWAALPATLALGPPATLLLRSGPSVAAGDSGPSLCFPVFLTFELLFGFVLPLCYAACATSLHRRRFLAAKCRCGACRTSRAHPHSSYAQLALAGLTGPALLWSAVVTLVATLSRSQPVHL